jgi:hypothetical protein
MPRAKQVGATIKFVPNPMSLEDLSSRGPAGLVMRSGDVMAYFDRN